MSENKTSNEGREYRFFGNEVEALREKLKDTDVFAEKQAQESREKRTTKLLERINDKAEEIEQIWNDKNAAIDECNTIKGAIKKRIGVLDKLQERREIADFDAWRKERQDLINKIQGIQRTLDRVHLREARRNEAAAWQQYELLYKQLERLGVDPKEKGVKLSEKYIPASEKRRMKKIGNKPFKSIEQLFKEEKGQQESDESNKA